MLTGVPGDLQDLRETMGECNFGATAKRHSNNLQGTRSVRQRKK